MTEPEEKENSNTEEKKAEPETAPEARPEAGDEKKPGTDRGRPSSGQRRGRRGKGGGPGGGPKGGRGRGRRGKEREEPEDDIKDTFVKINRCAKVVKGGRRFSFSALVVMGDMDGSVGVGFGKATEVPPSIEKGKKDARKNMVRIARFGTTIPHDAWGRFGAAKVLLLPARKGTGVIASAPVRGVAEAAGIHDILSKSYGTSNPVNVVKATMLALTSLRNKEEVERLRGVKI